MVYLLPYPLKKKTSYGQLGTFQNWLGCFTLLPRKKNSLTSWTSDFIKMVYHPPTHNTTSDLNPPPSSGISRLLSFISEHIYFFKIYVKSSLCIFTLDLWIVSAQTTLKSKYLNGRKLFFSRKDEGYYYFTTGDSCCGKTRYNFN